MINLHTPLDIVTDYAERYRSFRPAPTSRVSTSSGRSSGVDSLTDSSLVPGWLASRIPTLTASQALDRSKGALLLVMQSVQLWSLLVAILTL